MDKGKGRRYVSLLWQLQVFPALGTHWGFGPWDFGVIGY